MTCRILTIALILASIGVGHAQVAKQAKDPLADTLLSWTSGKWDGDDKPYKAIRDTVFGAMQRGKPPTTLVAQYKAEATSKPLDPQVVFRYAYATYQAGLRDPVFRRTSELYKANRAIKSLVPVHTYEFARLEFLLGAQLGAAGRALLPLGERLLLHNPSDMGVKYQLVNLLDSARFPEDAEKQKAYSQDLVNAFPKLPSVYATLGMTYFGVWQRTKSQADKEQSLAAFQKYLRLAPLHEDYRDNVRFTIKWLQDGAPPSHWP